MSLALKFSDLQLEPTLASEIEKLGYSECTPIQAAAMPLLLQGKDVAGLAQTGTGKTAAFLIPLMDRLLKSQLKTDDLSEEQKKLLAQRSFNEWRAQNFILILVPTRELAEQVYENIQKLGTACGLRGASVYGGTAYDKQKEAFSSGVEFVVATPGRLIDLYKEHFVDLKQVRAVVFDEADRMFDMGFKDDMKYILQRIPQNRQFLVFSATLNFDVLNTAYQFGADPVEINVSRDQARAENVKDEIFHCGGNDKPMYLLSLLKRNNPKQTIIFSNFKFNVERIARFLSDNGIPAMGISSLLTQVQRNRVLEQFKADNDRNILVATDVAARGLDIKGVDLVINFELPNDAESYVHRIGRTGRAGAEGRAFSLVGDKDIESLSRIEDYLKHKLEVGWLEDKDLIKEYKEFPREDFNSRPAYQGNGRNDRKESSKGGRRDSRRGAPPRGPHKDAHRGPRKEGAKDMHKDSRKPRHQDQHQDRHQTRGQNPNFKRHDSGHRPLPPQARGSAVSRTQHSIPRPHAKQKGVISKLKKFIKTIFGS